MRALMLARDGEWGTVYGGDEVVATWEGRSKVMMFRGEAKDIRDKYKEVMREGRREDEDFSE